MKSQRYSGKWRATDSSRNCTSEFGRRGYLSKDEIGMLFQKHMAAYMGNCVEQSQGSENWWVYWGHIRYFFYVYSYASGLLISKSLQNSVKERSAVHRQSQGIPVSRPV